ncbi:hypothetical protein FEG63_22000 [Mycolicibacterium sphagni]|uniref:Rhamnogalacturonase A/B/Epimerase-like pectate lyase domain-containing protein n=2 Tax=Mycolicibacterium sphagni TaxID=1786 RepID=A0ABX2K544_9MYCO|nr:hypothetical protein [Mycolicibacterium sphagni]
MTEMSRRIAARTTLVGAGVAFGATVLGRPAAPTSADPLVVPSAVWGSIVGKPFVDVRDPAFGAVGDGVANDSAALAAALAAAQAANQPLFFRPGTYLTDDIADGSNVPWIGDGYPNTTIKARTGSKTLLTLTDGPHGTAAAKCISGLTLDGAGISKTCLDSSYPTIGPSLRHVFHDLYIKSYQSIGWIGDNNNDAKFSHCSVAKHADTPGEAVAGRFHASGGAIALNNCNFALPIQISAQVATIRDGYNIGVIFDGPGWNSLSIHNGYLYANPSTHNNFDIMSGISAMGVAIFGTHIENTYGDGHFFGGAGNLTNVSAVGGHWFGIKDTTPSPRIAADTLSAGTLPGIVDMSGVFVENLNLSDASNVKVLTSNVDNMGRYQSATRIINTQPGTEINLGTNIMYTGPGTAVDAHMNSSGDVAVASSVNGDTAARISVHADGRITWGPGNAAPDVAIHRTGAGTLGTDGSFDAAAGLSIAGNPVGARVPAPATASSAGAVGQWAADSSYLYVCTAANTWKRASLSAW